MGRVHPEVAVLFARRDSTYKSLANCDVYDIDRDARTFPGGLPVVAHPPCRAWARLRAFAKPRPGEKELAVWAVDQVRRWGGVLEHPASSSLWAAMGLPLGRQVDEYGGFTLSVDQSWWGHKARKKTWLYIVGVSPEEIPPIPISFDAITHTIASSSRSKHKLPEVTKSEREATPPAFAEWLVELAKTSVVIATS